MGGSLQPFAPGRPNTEIVVNLEPRPRWSRGSLREFVPAGWNSETVGNLEPGPRRFRGTCGNSCRAGRSTKPSWARWRAAGRID
eukprot:896803-Alexandrium_andersonii.AAC.1